MCCHQGESSLLRRWHGVVTPVHVIIPALHHFARSPDIRLAFKEMVERKTGASVVIMYPSLEASIGPTQPR